MGTNPARPARHVAFEAADIVHEMDKSSSTEKSNRVNNNDTSGRARVARPNGSNSSSTESLPLEVSRYDNVLPQSKKFTHENSLCPTLIGEQDMSRKNETAGKALSSESVYDSPQESSSSLKQSASTK